MEDIVTIESRINALVEEKQRLTRKPVYDCRAMVMRENPELRKALVEATNAQKQKR